MRKFILITLSLVLGMQLSFAQNKQEKTRLVVLTDIENEPDDAESIVRLLLYSNELDIQGIIATTSTHMRDRVCPETIQNEITAYGKVRDNLLLHKEGYPTEEYLHSIVKSGIPAYGMKGVGEGKDSEGSDFLVSVIENQNDDRPIHIAVWGGVNTLAQALYKIRETRNEKTANAYFDRLWVYTISDQDDAGPWIRKEFPTVKFIVTPGYAYGDATWRGMNNTDDDGADKECIRNEWLAKNIQQGHGPLGAVYPDVAYSMEGDTPSFLGLIPNGLNVPEHPELGGWGGRYTLYTPEFRQSYNKADMLQYAAYMTEPVTEENRWRIIPYTSGVEGENVETPETRPIYTNAEDTVRGVDGKTYTSPFATIWRWRKDYQNDFAGRMDWCTKSYKEANHNPVIKLAHPSEITLKSGETFRLNSYGSYDPDGDSLSYEWIFYREASTVEMGQAFSVMNMHEIKITAPAVTSPQKLEYILRVTDKGTPAMTSYQRVTVNVIPAE